jgi:hypothetical protein
MAPRSAQTGHLRPLIGPPIDLADLAGDNRRSKPKPAEEWPLMTRGNDQADADKTAAAAGSMTSVTGSCRSFITTVHRRAPVAKTQHARIVSALYLDSASPPTR